MHEKDSIRNLTCHHHITTTHITQGEKMWREVAKPQQCSTYLAEVEGALVDSGSEVGKGVKVLACPHQNLSYSDSWCYDRSLRKLQNLCKHAYIHKRAQDRGTRCVRRE
jgi:hypothetical protein